MKYLKTLRLQNFQSHIDSEIELDTHFNCLIGVGHSGKTSFVRALHLLFYGLWDESWVNFNASHCIITGIFDDNSQLIRKKGEKINEYILISKDGKTQKFENFGTQVPKEVQEFSGVFPIEVPGGDEIKLNLHAQFGTSLIESVSSSNKAKLFGKLAGLDILDAVSQDLNLDRKQTQSGIKSGEDNLVNLNKKIESFVDLLKFRNNLNSLKDKIDVLGRQFTRLENIKNLNAEKIRWKERYNEAKEKSQKLAFIDNVSVDAIEIKSRRFQELYSVKNNIQKWKLKQGQIQQVLVDLDDRLNSAKEQYIYELKKSGTCPTCNNNITDECLGQLIQEL